MSSVSSQNTEFLDSPHRQHGSGIGVWIAAWADVACPASGTRGLRSRRCQDDVAVNEREREANGAGSSPERVRRVRRHSFRLRLIPGSPGHYSAAGAGACTLRHSGSRGRSARSFALRENCVDTACVAAGRGGSELAVPRGARLRHERGGLLVTDQPSGSPRSPSFNRRKRQSLRGLPAYLRSGFVPLTARARAGESPRSAKSVALDASESGRHQNKHRHHPRLRLHLCRTRPRSRQR